jgi:hypothetical protein
MKVLHKVKQLLQGFVLPEWQVKKRQRPQNNKPRTFLEFLRTPRIVRRVALGLALVSVSTFAALQVNATTQLGSDSLIDYTANLTATDLNRPVGRNTSTTVAVPTSTNDYSMQMWVNPGTSAASASSSDRILINMEKKYAVMSHQGRWQYLRGDGSNWYGSGARVDTGVSVIANRWTHISLVFTSSNTLFYVNGQLAHSTDRQTSGTGGTVPYMGIGNWLPSNSTQSFLFDGQVDEVKIWNTNRSLTTATDMHARQLGTSGLAHYWDFNEGSGSRVHDRVGGVHLDSTSSGVFSDIKQTSYPSGGDTIVTFPRTYLSGVGGWTVPASATNFRALVVAGGGGGGASYHTPGAGGGGAGGFLEQPVPLASGRSEAVQVGAGGTFGAAPQGSGSNGQNSVFASLTAIGGGGGGGRVSSGSTGGSGGGSGGRSSQAAVLGTFGQGNASGLVSGDWRGGSGGGGAGGLGGDATSTTGAAGGVGKISTISGVTYALGGKGGNGTTASNVGVTAGPNTGSGGGGADGWSGGSSSGVNGGSGGSGIVIVRYTPSVDLAYVGGLGNVLYSTSNPIPTGNIDPFTVEAWVFPTGPSPTPSDPWRAIFGGGNSLASEVNRFTVLLNSNDQVYVDVAGANTTFDTKIPMNQWTHITVGVAGNTTPVLQLHINGILVETRTAVGTRTGLGPVLTIGSGGRFLRPWVGQIDQVKIWSGRQESAVASSLHEYQKGAISATLLAHYDFNEFTNGIVVDRTGNGGNLTLDSSVTSSSFSSSEIVETGTAHSLQTFIQFNRSYLTAAGGWPSP